MKLNIALLLAFSLWALSCASREDISTAENIDIKRYMGVWYEIARYENSFQRGLKNCRAEYSLGEDGTVLVINSGEDENSKLKKVEGRAYASDRKDFSKLRVSFFWPFYGDYYILEIDKNYQWVLVGGRDKNYLWILARDKNLSERQLGEILKKAESRGYNTGKLRFNHVDR